MLLKEFKRGDTLILRRRELALILLEQKHPISAKNLAEKLKVSPKTIYSDIKKIHDEFQKFEIDIISEPGTGIYIDGNEHDKEKLYDYFQLVQTKDFYSPESRRIFIIKKIILENQNLSLEKLSSLFYVSKPSLYNDLKNINESIERFGVKFEIYKSNIYICGQELSIQKAVKHLLMTEYSNYDHLSFEEFVKNIFCEDAIRLTYAIREEEISKHKSFPYYYLYSLEMSLLIFFQRLLLGFVVKLNNHEKLISEKRQILFSNEVISKKIELDENSKIYLSYLIVAHNISMESHFDSKYVNVINTLLERMEDIENIEFTSNKQLFNSLLNHFPAMVLRLKMDIRIINPLTSKIKTEYKELFLELYFALSIVEDVYNIVLNDDEISLILIYFQIAIDSELKKNNILILFKDRLQNQQYIYSRVQPIFSEKDIVQIISEKDLNNINLNSFDLIINANESLENSLKQYNHVNVSYLVNEADYVKIVLAYANQVLLKQDSNIKVSIETFIEKGLITMSEKSIERFEALSILLDRLERLDYVTSEFKESVIDRERLSSTYIDNSIAVPHGNPRYVKRSSISLLHFKNQSNWGDESVKLVILLSITESDTKFVKGIINKIYRFVYDDTLRKKLFESNSKEVLYNTIKKL